MKTMQILAIAALAMLGGCGGGEYRTATPAELQAAIASGQVNPNPPTTRPSVGQRIDPQAPRPGYTVATESAGNGVQIEYFAPDGRNYLWYPGNRAVVPAQYRYGLLLSKDGTPGRIGTIEFLYPQYAVDRTDRRGGKWESSPISKYRTFVIDSQEGDVFNLSSGKVPYVRRGCDLPHPMSSPEIGFGICRK